MHKLQYGFHCVVISGVGSFVHVGALLGYGLTPLSRGRVLWLAPHTKRGKDFFRGLEMQVDKSYTKDLMLVTATSRSHFTVPHRQRRPCRR